jgi:hypothetical protein
MNQYQNQYSQFKHEVLLGNLFFRMNSITNKR